MQPFQMRIQSNIFDLVEYICRVVSLNKTRGLSCRLFSPNHVCCPALTICRVPALRPRARHQGVHIITKRVREEDEPVGRRCGTGVEERRSL
jgi:hypothetical protein